MAYTTGTCAGHLALLDALKAFLEAQGWVTKRYTTGDTCEYIAMGPGLTGADEIYVGIQTYADTLNQYYNWKLRGYTGYSALLDFDSQPGSLQRSSIATHPSLLLTNLAIQYWFFANSRRVIIVAKCGTSYECAYLGLVSPYAPESQLSYPLFIGGSHYSVLNSYLDQETAHFSFWNPQAVSAGSPAQSALLCNNIWQNITNRNDLGTELVIHPYCGYPISEESPSSTSVYQFWNIQQNIDGSYPLFPCKIMSNYGATTRGILGELDGVYAVPSFNLVSEDVITVDAVDYLVVQSAYRTSHRSYAAIRLA